MTACTKQSRFCDDGLDDVEACLVTAVAHLASHLMAGLPPVWCDNCSGCLLRCEAAAAAASPGQADVLTPDKWMLCLDGNGLVFCKLQLSHEAHVQLVICADALQLSPVS